MKSVGKRTVGVNWGGAKSFTCTSSLIVWNRPYPRTNFRYVTRCG